MKIGLFIKKTENIRYFNHYNGTSIKKTSIDKLLDLLKVISCILNRAEAVMAQFLLLFLYSQKKAVIRPKLNIR